MKTKLFLIFGLLLFGLAACAGAGNMAGGPIGSGDPGAGDAGSPSGEFPFEIPADIDSDNGDNEGDDGDNPAPRAPTRPSRSPNPNPDGRSSLTCSPTTLTDGVVDELYEQTITVEGGSGGYELEPTPRSRLQELGLRLDGNRLTGTPINPGNKSIGILITDNETGARGLCNLSLTIREVITIGLTDLSRVYIAEDNPQQNDWRNVYQVTINGKANPDNYRWTWSGDISNVCFSGGEPDIGYIREREGCQPGPDTAPVNGKSTYLWLKENNWPDTELGFTLTVSGDFVLNPVIQTFLFKYSNPIIAHADEIGTGTVPVSFPKATEIYTTILTGNHRYAGTDCHASIKFCKGPKPDSSLELEDCVAPLLPVFNTDNDSLERGDRSTFNLTHFPLPPISPITKDHKYFEIKLLDDECSGNSLWLMQGVDLVITYSDNVKYRYYNPCVNKWLAPEDRLVFGPNDTAICTVVETGTQNNPGTDDDIYLVINKETPDGYHQIERTSLLDFAPRFTAPIDEYITMFLDWEIPEGGYANTPLPYDDFENGDKASYGDYFFNEDPVFSHNDAPLVQFAKERGGDEWLLKRYQVFIYQPGKMADEEVKVYYLSQTPNIRLDRDNAQIGEDPSDPSYNYAVSGFEVMQTLYYRDSPFLGSGQLWDGNDEAVVHFNNAIGGYW